MTILPQFTRTSNLTAGAKSAIFCGLQREFRMTASTRVKGRPTSQPHVKARLCDSVLPERGANKAPIAAKFTAVYPRQDSV